MSRDFFLAETIIETNRNQKKLFNAMALNLIVVCEESDINSVCPRGAISQHWTGPRLLPDGAKPLLKPMLIDRQ